MKPPTISREIAERKPVSPTYSILNCSDKLMDLVFKPSKPTASQTEKQDFIYLFIYF